MKYRRRKATTLYRKPKHLFPVNTTLLWKGKAHDKENVPSDSSRRNKEKQEATGKTRDNVKYLTRKQLEEIHVSVISETHEKNPERPHILNPCTLELALNLPKTKLYGTELYSDLFEKAAVLMKELISGHPFEAANKRTGYLAASTFLQLNGYVLESSEDEATKLTVNVAMDKLSVKDIAAWLRKRSESI